MKIQIGFSPKTVKISDNDFLHFFYANNKGRGDSNCTIIRSHSENRKATSKLQYEEVTSIAKEITSSWQGNVNFSKKVQASLGL